MTLMRKVELGFGLATPVVCAIALYLEEVPRIVPGFAAEMIEGMAVLFVPALLVAIGSFLHAARKKKYGLIILWIAGVPLVVLWSVGGLFGGVLYIYGLWGGLIMLSPGLPALITLIASLFVRQFEKVGD